MTYKKAIDYVLGGAILRNPSKYLELRTMIIESLEKQEPKKPIDNHHCPSCETGLPHKGFTDEWCKCCFELDYCPRCGQAIDWR